MKKVFAVICIVILGILFLSATPSQKTVVLYQQDVGNLTNEQVDVLWPSNNPRSWILTGTMDGEITKRYKVWQNRYKSQVNVSTDQRGLEDDTDLTIHIKNLHIKSSDFQDIRLIIDYLSKSGSNGLTHTYSMELYAIDDRHNKYGPYNIADFEVIGFYMRKSGTSEIYDRNFHIVTERIKVPENTVITELEMKPYGNYPRLRNDGKTIKGNWRGADGTTFEVAGMKIVGYKDSTYQRPNYIKTKSINVDSTREKIVKRMYDFATIKWSPSVDFHDTRVVGSNPRVARTTYKVGNDYYGLPYTQNNRVSLEKFANEIHNGVLSKPENIFEIWGADCGSSITSSISKYIPMHVITDGYIWDRNKSTLLGNLKISGKEAGTDCLKRYYNEQEIYEAYAKLQKGDIVSTHYKKNTHVRLISGNTHVERNPNGSINPEKSYFIRTDIRITQANTKKGSNDFGGLLNEQDYVVPFEPKVQYTDIKSLSELEGKNLNFYINTKTSFKEAYAGNYVPITLNAYLTATVEEPYVRIINPNTVDNIKKGLKGTIISNYTILSVKFNIKNSNTGEEKTFIDYPKHNNSTLEGKYSNAYSLYYHTPENVQNYVKKILKNSNDFEVSIFISAGEKDNLEVIRLKR